jgi:hypothetical protein
MFCLAATAVRWLQPLSRRSQNHPWKGGARGEDWQRSEVRRVVTTRINRRAGGPSAYCSALNSDKSATGASGRACVLSGADSLTGEPMQGQVVPPKLVETTPNPFCAGLGVQRQGAAAGAQQDFSRPAAGMDLHSANAGALPSRIPSVTRNREKTVVRFRKDIAVFRERL